MQRLIDIDLEMVLQLGLAIVLAGLVGLEREWRGRAAGLRTMVLVSVGSTTMMLASARLAETSADSAAISADPTRVAAGIITGVGFLGAGVILKLGDHIRGVTTSAAIWFVAGLGIVIGCKNYPLAIGSTAVVLMVLLLLHYAERHVPQQIYRTLTVTTAAQDATDVLKHGTALISRSASRILDVRVTQRNETRITVLSLYVRSTRGMDPLALVQQLSELHGVHDVDWK